MDIRTYNRDAWDAEVARGNRWTLPVGPDVIQAAREGRWEIVLTPELPVPGFWFPESLEGVAVLCLASGGGQQAPILAAAGALVTTLDNSPAQLAQDRQVAEREGLTLRTVEGDMRDLAAFEDASFDLVVFPVAHVFIPDTRPVWREAFRVLKPGGALISGLANPAQFIFDHPALERGEFVVRHTLPYSDLTSLNDEERNIYIERNEPLHFGQTLNELIGGQLEVGFALVGFYEDTHPEDALSTYMSQYFATRALKF